MVEWAKTIPIYESLPIGDKVTLLSLITFFGFNKCRKLSYIYGDQNLISKALILLR